MLISMFFILLINNNSTVSIGSSYSKFLIYVDLICLQNYVTYFSMIAREYAANDLSVLIADMDISQSTSFVWNGRRLEKQVLPEVGVQQFRKVDSALKAGNQ